MIGLAGKMLAVEGRPLGVPADTKKDKPRGKPDKTEAPGRSEERGKKKDK